MLCLLQVLALVINIMNSPELAKPNLSFSSQRPSVQLPWPLVWSTLAFDALCSLLLLGAGVAICPDSIGTTTHLDIQATWEGRGRKVLIYDLIDSYARKDRSLVSISYFLVSCSSHCAALCVCFARLQLKSAAWIPSSDLT
jgi:hypothetical protein